MTDYDIIKIIKSIIPRSLSGNSSCEPAVNFKQYKSFNDMKYTMEDATFNPTFQGREKLKQKYVLRMRIHEKR